MAIEQQRVVELSQTQAPELVTLAEVEKRHIIQVVSATNGNVKRAAKILDISRGTLYRKLKSYGINVH